MDLPFEQWWFHGYKNKPPAANTFMTLPAGGVYKGQVACNKALTTFGQNPSQQTGIYACDGDGPQGGIGAMHTADQWGSPNPTDVKGCGLAIAYTSDANAVQPQDFAVISTNYTCPWFKAVDFQIPSDIPACPEAGCLCSWGWIHADDAGSEQMFHLVYRCKVDAATGTTPIPAGRSSSITRNLEACADFDYSKDGKQMSLPLRHVQLYSRCQTTTLLVPSRVSVSPSSTLFVSLTVLDRRNNNPQGQYDPPFCMSSH